MADRPGEPQAIIAYLIVGALDTSVFAISRGLKHLDPKSGGKVEATTRSFEA